MEELLKVCWENLEFYWKFCEYIEKFWGILFGVG